MTDWLYKEDNYAPAADKDNFIDRTILSMLNLISKIRHTENYYDIYIYKINSTLKLCFTFLALIFLSLSRSYTYVLLLSVYVLFILSSLKTNLIKKIISVSILIPIFTLIMLLPSIFMGNIYNSFLICFKVFVGVLYINILSNTTKQRHITSSLKLFFIPDIFILVLEITIKYIIILGDFSLNMLYALKLRSVGKNNKKYVSVSKLMGNLFLKSKEMSELTYSAMECRGFTGEYTAYNKFNFTLNDFFYIIINVFIICLYFFI